MKPLTVEGAFNQNFANQSREAAEVKDLGSGRFSARFGEHHVEFIVRPGTSGAALIGETQSAAARLLHMVKKL